jgi:hypothetical protein
MLGYLRPQSNLQLHLSALYRWHDRNLLVRPEEMITSDKFDPGTDEDAAVPIA